MFHQQDERRLRFDRNLHVVEVHQAAQRRHDDGARAGKAHLARNRGLVPHREVPVVQPHPHGTAVLHEPLDRRLDQADAAVVAVQADIACQVVHRVEAGAVVVGEHDLDGVPLVQHHLRPEIADADRNRLAVIAVGWIAEQAGARVGALTGEKQSGTPGAARFQADFLENLALGYT